MLVGGLPWTPADHTHFPPALKAAVRTLLLAHRRGSPTAGATGVSAAAAEAHLQSSLLSGVPVEFVLRVIAAAAFPLEPWLAPDPSKSEWRALELFRGGHWTFL